MSITSDSEDPGLGRKMPNGQYEKYLVLSEEERAKGFVAPYRTTYVHGKCGAATTMGRTISETYARDPKFYGSTFCADCGTHFPITEFRWDDGDVLGSVPEPKVTCAYCLHGGKVKVAEYAAHLREHASKKEGDIGCERLSLAKIKEELREIMKKS